MAKDSKEGLQVRLALGHFNNVGPVWEPKVRADGVVTFHEDDGPRFVTQGPLPQELRVSIVKNNEGVHVCPALDQLLELLIPGCAPKHDDRLDLCLAERQVEGRLPHALVCWFADPLDLVCGPSSGS